MPPCMTCFTGKVYALPKLLVFDVSDRIETLIHYAEVLIYMLNTTNLMCYFEVFLRGIDLYVRSKETLSYLFVSRFGM